MFLKYICFYCFNVVEVIRHFAMMEFDTGAVDRGRVLMGELLSSYPNATICGRCMWTRKWSWATWCRRDNCLSGWSPWKWVQRWWRRCSRSICSLRTSTETNGVRSWWSRRPANMWAALRKRAVVWWEGRRKEGRWTDRWNGWDVWMVIGITGHYLCADGCGWLVIYQSNTTILNGWQKRLKMV